MLHASLLQFLFTQSLGRHPYFLTFANVLTIFLDEVNGIILEDQRLLVLVA